MYTHVHTRTSLRRDVRVWALSLSPSPQNILLSDPTLASRAIANTCRWNGWQTSVDSPQERRLALRLHKTRAGLTTNESHATCKRPSSKRRLTLLEAKVTQTLCAVAFG